MKWIIKETDEQLVQEFQSYFNLPEVICKLLINRGLKSIEEADYFLNRNYKFLENPFKFSDMPAAVERINRAIANNENILIAGDRDVDGVTSISILYKILKAFGLNVNYSLPSADQDYGFVPEIFDICKNNKINLIITVDNGITEIENISKLKELNIDTIVTDHHIPDNVLPQAVAIINPNMLESEYPCPFLSGGAVAFKLGEALILSKNFYYTRRFLFIELLTTGKTFITGKLLGLNYVYVKNFQIESKKIIIEEYVEEYDKLFKIRNEKCDIISEEKFIILLDEIIKKSDELYLKNKIYGIDFLKELYKKHNRDLLLADFKEFEDEKIINYSPFCKNSIQGFVEGFIYKIFFDDVEYKLFNDKFITITALSIIGDVMSMTSENRLMVKYGLNSISENVFLGLRKLIEYLNLNITNITARDIGFKIVPILNAARRMKLGEVTLNMLLSEDEKNIITLINQLLHLNDDRKNKFNDYKDIVFDELLKQVDIENDYVFVISTDKIEHGVTGLIANKIKEEFNRPVIILIIKDNIAQGTARSVDNFNVLEAFGYIKDILIKYGGHRTAAGLTLYTANIDNFRIKINEYAGKIFKEIQPTDILDIDAEIKIDDINETLYNNIEKLKPFGKDNQQPVFLLRNVSRIYKKTVGVDNTHLKLTLFHNNSKIDGIGFELGKFARYDAPIDIAFTIEKNKFNGRENLQLNIKDIKTVSYNNFEKQEF